MRDATKAALDNVLDMATGADGGVGYMRLRSLLDEMDGRAEKGDAAAAEIVAMLTRFSRLIDLANKL